jgi:hypothetical protein
MTVTSSPIGHSLVKSSRPVTRNGRVRSVDVPYHGRIDVSFLFWKADRDDVTDL